MTSRLIRLAMGMALAAVVAVGFTAPANASPVQQSSPGCVDHQHYTGGRWLTLYLCSYGVQGSSGYSEDAIYLDRATRNNPSTWTGWLAVNYHHWLTGTINQSGYWWRTCVHETDTGHYFCTPWYYR